MLSITHRHIIYYACGCTTTRIEVTLAGPGQRTVCAGHLEGVIKEEHVVEYEKEARVPRRQNDMQNEGMTKQAC